MIVYIGIYLLLGALYSFWCRNKGLDQVIETVPAPAAVVITFFIIFWAPILALDIYNRVLKLKK